MGSLGHGRTALSTQLVTLSLTLRLGASGSVVSPMSPQPQGHSLLTEHHPHSVGSPRPALGMLGTLLSHVLRTLAALGLRMRTLRMGQTTALALSSRHSTTLSPRASLSNSTR